MTRNIRAVGFAPADLDAALVEGSERLLGVVAVDGTLLRANARLATFLALDANRETSALWLSRCWPEWRIAAAKVHWAVREAAQGRSAHLAGYSLDDTDGPHEVEFEFRPLSGLNRFGLAAIAVAGQFGKGGTRESGTRCSRLSRLYHAIFDTNRAVMGSAGPEEIYRAVCDACVRLGGFRLAWIGLHDPLSDYVIPVEAAGPATSYLDGIKIGSAPDSVLLGMDPARRAYVEQRVCFAPDDDASSIWHVYAAQHGLTSAVSLPLQRSDAPFGTLTVYGDDTHELDDETVALLEEMAGSISFAVDYFDRESHRRQTEAALRASEARLQEAQAVGRIGDWELDRETGAMTWSPELFHLFERPLEFGAPDLNEALAYYDSDSLEQTRARFWHAIDTGERSEFEQIVVLPSGATRYHATQIVPVKTAEGRVYKLFGTVQDVTERRLADEQLRRKSLEIEDLYQNAPCGYHSIDVNGRIIRINDTELRWLGYSRAEVVGRLNIRDVLSSGSRKAFDKQFALFKKSGIVSELQLDLIRKDGTLLPVRLSSTSIRDADGNYVASRTVVTDESARRQLETERATHTARLAELSRHMVDVQENERRKLAAELHDRASPNLAALQLTLSNLAGVLPPSVLDEAEPLLGDAKALLLDTTAGIREICADLRPATLDYAGLIPALQDYAQHFEQRTGIAVRLEINGLHIQLLPNLQSLLFRIVQEALTNCAKHARAGTIRIRLAETTTHLVLTISDNGVGFDSSLLGEVGSAPGLGLLTMKERAEFAGGHFTLVSNPKDGTEITVTFDLNVLKTLLKTGQHPSRRASDRLIRTEEAPR